MSRRRRRRWLLWLSAAVAALLLLVIAALALLLHSSAGAGWALQRAVAALPPGALAWDSYQGSLGGGLSLQGLRYRDAGLELDIAELSLAVSPVALASGRLQLRQLRANGLRLQLPPAASEAASEPFEIRLPDALPSLELPISIGLDQVLVDDFRLEDAAGEAIFEAARFETAATLDGGALGIQALQLDSPWLRLNARGTLDSAADWTGALQLQGAWLRGLEVEQPFELQLQGPLQSLSAQLRFPDAPAVEFDLRTTGGLPDPSWKLQLQLPAPPLPLSEFWPPGLADVSLQGEGSMSAATVSGSALYQGQSWRLAESKLQLQQGRLHIDPLELQQGEGRVQLQGSLLLPVAGAQDIESAAADLPEVELSAQFSALPLPLGEGPPLILDGMLQARGPLQQALLELDLAVARGARRGSLRGGVQLEASAARLQGLQVRTGEGQLSAEGRIDWAEGLAWELEAGLSEFAPELLAPAWPGRISARLSSSGSYQAAEPDQAARSRGRLQLSELAGNLRNSAVGGAADFEWTSLEAGLGQAELRWGASNIAAELVLGKELTGHIELQPLALNPLLEDAAGRISGRIDLAGTAESPRASWQLRGSALRWASIDIDSLSSRGQIGSRPQDPLQLLLEARGLAQAERPIGALSFSIDGSRQQHALELALEHPQQDGLLVAEGGWGASGSGWQGELRELDYRSTGPQALPGDWTLAAPAAMNIGGASLRIEPLCLVAKRPPQIEADLVDADLENTADPAAEAMPVAPAAVGRGRVCLQADWSEDAQGRLLLSLQGLPIAVPGAVLGGALEPGTAWRWQGELQGQVEVRGRADDWRIEGRIVAPRGGLGLPGPEPRWLLQWQDLFVQVQGDSKQLQLGLGGQLGGQSLIEGAIELLRPLDADGALSGNLKIELDQLGALELLSAEAVVAPVGQLSANIDISGSRAQPLLRGGLQLQGFAAELPALGISPSEGFLKLDLLEAQQARFEFGLRSGGELRGEGRIDLAETAETPLEISLQGSDLLLSDTSQIRLTASPDLQLRQRGQALLLRGKLQVPSADIRLERFEGSLQASPDVVVLDPVGRKRGVVAAQRLDADLRVALGEDVRLEGFGLEGKLSGELRVRDRPGRATTGSGSLNVSGRYEAYGQKLEITRGRLSYAQSPLENPALDIRAERKFDEVTAGIRVTGSAVAPQLSLWSEPALDQADVLSYLVLGRPLRAARSGEGQQLNAAAAALGAGGNLLAERLGARLGLDQAGVEESAALGAAALTVGKFLSPRLYVAYGVALFGEGQVFSIKYLLSETWDVQLDATERENSASLNYRLER